MTKADIIDEVASATGLTKVETEAVLEGVIQSVITCLSSGQRVDIRGFGSFVVKKRSARDAHNPATREVVKLKERFVPSFKVSKILKDKVNKALLRGF
jgi:nucleoid DNA-binding protein